MASLTLKNLPDQLLGRLRERASQDRRSLNQELIFLLDHALADSGSPMSQSVAPGGVPTFAAERQIRAWSSLAGRWDSDLSAEEEIESILRRRTRGREVEL